MEQAEINNQNGDAVALNRTLVDDLKNRGILQSQRIESAFQEVLRHHFLPATPLEEVYSDRAISAKQDQNGQWISSSSQPAIMAIMLEQLGLEPGHKILEIGAGTGYNAALMTYIVGEAGQVVTVDIDEDLVESAREHLTMAGYEQVQVVCADGGYGYPEAAPFDRIILTVAAPDITPAWWDQMKPDGRLVLPLTFKGSMKSIAFKQVDDHLESISVKECGFIPLRGDFAATSSNRVQLGPIQGLYVETDSEVPIDPDAVYRLLTSPGKDWETGVEVAVWDVLAGDLWMWLALHESRMCKLVAEGEVVAQDIVPSVIGIDGKQKSTSTAALVDETALFALMRPPGQPVPLVERDKLFASDSPFVLPFKLFLRQFGSDESTAQRLVTQIQTWDAAGRPSSDEMQIRAYPKNAAYEPSEGEYLLEKQWTKIVLAWSEAARMTEG
jgi:protein-L-isoaspartate(D-aspartate) O-methyltransferase